MSQAEIKTCLTDKMYLLYVTTFQLGILLNFNEMETCSIRDLITATGLQENEILKVNFKNNTHIIAPTNFQCWQKPPACMEK